MTEETPGGTKIKMITHRRWHEREYIVKPQGDRPFKIDGRGYDAYHRARLSALLCDRVEEFRVVEDRKTVPINIVNEGKAAVAAYLFAVNSWSGDEVGEMMGLSKNTIDQYLAAVRHKRR